MIAMMANWKRRELEKRRAGKEEKATNEDCLFFPRLRVTPVHQDHAA